MEQWEIGARAEIATLLAEYVRCVDTGASESLAELFTEDCMYGLLDVAAQGRDAIGASVAEVQARFASAADTTGRIRHHCAISHLSFVSREQARAVTYFVAIGGLGPDHWGDYRDLLTNRGGEWRFERRMVGLHGAAPSSPVHGLIGSIPAA